MRWASSSTSCRTTWRPTADNAWWIDVLARGPRQPLCAIFRHRLGAGGPELRGKVLLPILGRPYADALAAGEIAYAATMPAMPSSTTSTIIFRLRPALALFARQASSAAFDPASSAGRTRLHRLLEEPALSARLVADRE